MNISIVVIKLETLCSKVGCYNTLFVFLLILVKNMWLIYIPEYPNHAFSLQSFSELHPYPQKGSAAPDPPYLTGVQNLISETKP